MGLLFDDLNINNNAGHLVTFGNRADVCLFAARELARVERIDISLARRKLAGKLEGQKIVKFMQSGAEIVISLDYIHKIAEAFPREPEEVANDESKESE